MRLVAFVASLCLITACERSGESRQDSSAGGIDDPLTQPLEDRLARVAPGTPRSEVLRVAKLTEEDGAKRVSYYADICGSMEEWITSSGEKIYVQGHFFDQNGYREEPYIIGIMRLDGESGGRDEVIWSGLNLQSGTDMFAAWSNSNGEQGGAEQPPARGELKSEGD